MEDNTDTYTSGYKTSIGGDVDGEDFETKQLQLLLKERQLETRKASKSLGSSLKEANELLERILSDRKAG